MASSSISHFSLSSPPSSFKINFENHRPIFPRARSVPFSKQLTNLKASASLDVSAASVDNKTSTALKANNWRWKFKNNSVSIYYEEHEKESTKPTKNILMIPTISDVSTVEEWRLVARDIVQRAGEVNWRATIVDWPGLGYSDRPKLDYNADVMEKFLVDFIAAPDSPLSAADCCGSMYNGSRIHSGYTSLQGSCLDSKVIGGAWAQAREDCSVL